MALVEKKVKEGKVAEVMKVEEGGEHKPSAEILDLSELLKRSLKKGGAPAKRGSKAAQSSGDDSGEETARPARKTARRKRA
jgi:DNA end-binding protein Ku